MTHTVGIVGLGTVGRRFVEQYQRHPGFELAVAWDLSAAAREAAARDFGAPVVDTLDQLLASAPDIVYLATPPGTHRTLVEGVVDAGSAVFCEKPLGVDETDSRALVAAVASEAAPPCAVNFVFGAAPGAVEWVRAVRAGELGALSGIDLRLHFARWPRDWQAGATWLADRAEGGFTREVISHFVFLVLRARGQAEVSWSQPRWPADSTGAETAIHAELDAAGVPVSVVATSGGVGPDTVSITARGASASLRLADWYRLERAVDDGSWQADDTPFADLAAGAYAAQLDAVAAMIDGRDHPLASFAEALEVQLVVERLREV